MEGSGLRDQQRSATGMQCDDMGFVGAFQLPAYVGALDFKRLDPRYQGARSTPGVIASIGRSNQRGTSALRRFNLLIVLASFARKASPLIVIGPDGLNSRIRIATARLSVSQARRLNGVAVDLTAIGAGFTLLVGATLQPRGPLAIADRDHSAAGVAAPGGCRARL
ncbi:hypothetical protein RPC_0999 [Rhodopseudomonas palustris BisB18]|uniref:Uncharacterized protein n=1 Tax=Rhodopseudomonas palustris (strain BisB18) TaxID=316056 RepID=Q21AL7_RHOPB